MPCVSRWCRAGLWMSLLWPAVAPASTTPVLSWNLLLPMPTRVLWTSTAASRWQFSSSTIHTLRCTAQWGLAIYWPCQAFGGRAWRMLAPGSTKEGTGRPVNSACVGIDASLGATMHVPE